MSETSQRSGVRPGEESLHTDRLLVELGLGSIRLKVSLFFVSLVSGSVWSSYRKSCVNMVMKWLIPESSSRYINRMTNEALHKGEHTFGVLTFISSKRTLS